MPWIALDADPAAAWATARWEARESEPGYLAVQTRAPKQRGLLPVLPVGLVLDMGFEIIIETLGRHLAGGILSRAAEPLEEEISEYPVALVSQGGGDLVAGSRGQQGQILPRQSRLIELHDQGPGALGQHGAAAGPGEAGVEDDQDLRGGQVPKPLKVRVSLVITVDVKSYRDNYGTDDLATISRDIQHAVLDAVASGAVLHDGITNAEFVRTARERGKEQ